MAVYSKGPSINDVGKFEGGDVKENPIFNNSTPAVFLIAIL